MVSGELPKILTGTCCLGGFVLPEHLSSDDKLRQRFEATAPSYSSTPNEKTSLRASTCCPAACSGDMYAMVPRITRSPVELPALAKRHGTGFRHKSRFATPASAPSRNVRKIQALRKENLIHTLQLKGLRSLSTTAAAGFGRPNPQVHAPQMNVFQTVVTATTVGVAMVELGAGGKLNLEATR